MAKKEAIKFKLLSLSASDKAENWAIKIKGTAGVAEAKAYYDCEIKVDENYFLRKIEDYNKKIEKIEAQPDMFDDYKASIQSLKDNIASAQCEKENLKELEIDKFSAITGIVDFQKSTLILEVQEEIIPDLIKIRHQVECFVVILK